MAKLYMEQLRVKLDLVADLLREAGAIAENYLNGLLDRAGVDEINFREWVAEGGLSVAITYDGGRHPEYDSNAFSEVWGFGRRNGLLYLIIEDCDEYEVDRCDTHEFACAVSNIQECEDRILEWLEENKEV